ncbi:hypothetical protein [Deinococcus sp. SL84]|uniref:hypothetical protein n=1 Tax=Deinococcus sp. SL84 TaxID=2994663 RepID=UPI002275EECA|nr:hypothetical protein [Deinococcus sp. SL84]MCY1703534.1 hypothetical protein [Deinococcus sp. SL84]
MTVVTDAKSLEQAIGDKASSIEIQGQITGLSSVKLPKGTTLTGGEGAELHFKDGQPGLMLNADHRVSGLRIVADETQVALGLLDEEKALGTIEISDVRTVGRFHLEGTQALSGDLKLKNIHVEQADAHMAAHRPAGFGVEVLLGGFSVYNSSKNKDSKWTLSAENISGGSKDSPLKGSGVFVFGGWYIPTDANPAEAPAPTAEGGSIELVRLTTGEIHSQGQIPPGISNLITGGVFVGSGVHAQEVVNEGAVSTYGPNDMVLDNWGQVESWVAQAAVTSHGPSGIGFVNFGDIESLQVQAPLETHGLGARGFNLYDGSLQRAEFESITTYGDGAIGVQLSKPFGSIRVSGDIRTKGGEGESLVRGKVTKLKANALSLKEGTRGDEFVVGGTVEAESQDVESYDFEAPASVIGRLEVGGEVVRDTATG